MKEINLATAILLALKAYVPSHGRPLAHFSKKGPGRKHQQGKRA